MTSSMKTTAVPTATKNGRKPTRRSAAKPTRARAKRRPAKTKVDTAAPPEKTATKREQLAALLVRDEGVTIDQMRAATGWLPHTVRAALTGLRKLGYAIDSDKVDGLRTYRAVAPQ